MLWIWPWATSPSNIMALVSVPTSRVRVENQEMLSVMGATEISFVDEKYLHSGCCNHKNIPGSKKGFCKSCFATMENSEWTLRLKGIFLTGNRTVFTLSSSVKWTLPRKDDVSCNILIPATYPAGSGIICIFGNRQLAFSKHVKFLPSAALHWNMERIGSLAQCYHFIRNSWRSIFVLSLQFFVISFW